MYRAIRYEGTHLHRERLASDAVLRAQGIDVGEMELDLRRTVRVRQGAQAYVHAAVAFTLQLHRDVIARVRHQTLHLVTQNERSSSSMLRYVHRQNERSSSSLLLYVHRDRKDY